MNLDIMKNLNIIFLSLMILLGACGDDQVDVTLDDTPYNLEYGSLPDPELPADNPLTVQGVELGRMLFYEPMLSGDNTQSCATCHRQSDGFSDTMQLSLGIRGLPGKRQAMPVFNMAWHSNDFFWDGRAGSLRDQALRPIQDPLEMDETLGNVIDKLGGSRKYREQFTRAFGDEEVTEERIALALEQFMLSIVSFNSKYDRYLRGEVQLTESEERGRVLFETEYNPFFPQFSGADCVHCHGGLNFENDQYMNNGLDTDDQIDDEGRMAVTGNPLDRGKFKVPSLRNVAVTPPYMHDGRFRTLEEVIDHYNAGIKESSTADPTVLNTKDTGLFLDEQDKQDLINFLKTLTDPVFLANPEYQSPF